MTVDEGHYYNISSCGNNLWKSKFMVWKTE